MKKIFSLTIVLFIYLAASLPSLQAAGLTNLQIEIIPRPQCSDGKDNDGDGLIDYPQDPDCLSLSDKKEATAPQCSDGADNDGDGLVDYPQDTDCSSASDISEDSQSNQGGSSGAGSGATPGITIKPSTSIRFSGYAYPLSQVDVLQDAQLVISTIAGPDAKFDVVLTNLSEGNFVFSLRSTDEEGRSSPLFTFPLYITAGATTHVSGIFLAPSITTDKKAVKQGEVIKILGKATPDSRVTVSVSSEKENFLQTMSNQDGFYLVSFDTTILSPGEHLAKARAAQDNLISPWSNLVRFDVGKVTINRETGGCFSIRGDFNCDSRVNLVDFSILAYWYDRPLSDDFAQIEAKYLNGDGKVDLVDFSILAYYWTG